MARKKNEMNGERLSKRGRPPLEPQQHCALSTGRSSKKPWPGPSGADFFF